MLRPYQTHMLDAIRLTFAKGLNRQLCKAPTGTGKTVTFAAMPTHFDGFLSQFREGDRRMLVIAHREELLDQAADKIQAQNPKLDISIEQGDRHASSWSDVVIASIQTLAASDYRRLDRLVRQRQPRIVVVDEAHHAAAKTYRNTLARLGFLPMVGADVPDYDDERKMQDELAAWDTVAPKDRLLVGVTATPNRTDAIGLGCVFQTISYSYALKQAIADKWLVPIVPWVVETRDNLDDVRVNRGEFNQRDLADTVNNPERNALGVAAWGDYADGRQTIAFSVDVAHAHAIAEAFRTAGVTAEAVSGETPTEQRRDMLQRFREGRLTVLVNCMVLTEGTDLPMASCILHMKPTKSATLYEQMTGRGLRIHPGKADCVVIDVVDIARRHSLQAAPVLYGLPPGIKSQGADLREVEDAIEKLMLDVPGLNPETVGRKTLAELRAFARTFDIWKVPDMGVYGAGLSMRWVRLGAEDEKFQLSYPWQESQEIVTVEKDLLGHFEVSVHARPPAGGSMPAEPPRTVASSLPTADAALQLAESFVKQERREVTRLTDNSASWRRQPASEKQLAILRKWRAPIKPGLTKGEASDMLDAKIARGRR